MVLFGWFFITAGVSVGKKVLEFRDVGIVVFFLRVLGFVFVEFRLFKVLLLRVFFVGWKLEGMGAFYLSYFIFGVIFDMKVCCDVVRVVIVFSC